MRPIHLAALALTLFACTTPDEPAPTPPPIPLPPAEAAPLTTEQTLALNITPIKADLSTDPREPAILKQLLADGYGDYTIAAGKPMLPRTLDGSAPPAPGPSPKLLTRFFHLADTQLADDESPARLCGFDGPDQLAGPFRAQEGHECLILNAAVRTMNAVHKNSPVEMVLLGGDNIDNAQENELDWFQKIMNGGEIVSCDSGANDDPIPGPNNDQKDAFAPVGLDIPWYWVTGNHDALVQGTFVVSDGQRERAIGEFAVGGTRDYRLPGAPVQKTDVPKDPTRALMDHNDLVKNLAKYKTNGIDETSLTSAKAQYTFDSKDGSIRFIIFDSTSPFGSSEGLVRKTDLDTFLEPALAKAEAEGKWVILVSHHSSRMLTDGGQAGGTAQMDAILPDPFRAVIAAHKNVLAHLAGHTHLHRITTITAAPGAYWEIETSALADYPHQIRLLEIWDNDNGFLTLRSKTVDYTTENDPRAEEGRKISNADYTSGWGQNSPANNLDWNVELFVKKQ